jgi:glycine dehydrogenase
VEIARSVNAKAILLAEELNVLGFKIVNKHFFDTIIVDVGTEDSVANLSKIALEHKINFRYFEGKTLVGISVDESTLLSDLGDVLRIFQILKKRGNASENLRLKEKLASLLKETGSSHSSIPAALVRTSPFLTHPIFNMYHCEMEMTRYLHKLQDKDMSLVHAMIPLGSCTMKLNSTTEMVC